MCRGLVSHPEACVRMANTLFGEKKLSDLTVVELKMELDKRGLSKKGTKSVLAKRLKYFGDHVNIAMRKKGKIGGTSTIISATAVDGSNDDNVTRNSGNCDLCCKKILDGKEETVQCEGVCGLWFHRYCAGISATHFQRLSTTNAPFVCFTCYQHDQHVLTAQLQSEVVSLKAEIIKFNELICSVPVSNVCVSTDNQSYSGTETKGVMFVIRSLTGLQ